MTIEEEETVARRMAAIEQANHDETLSEIRALNDRLQPIYETYQAWLTFGRWGKMVLYTAGAILGLLIALRQLIRK